jgi:hypothetical protein
MRDEPRRCEALSLLPDQLTIYRGVAKGNNVNGLSWTLSRETAMVQVADAAIRIGFRPNRSASAPKRSAPPMEAMPPPNRISEDWK